MGSNPTPPIRETKKLARHEIPLNLFRNMMITPLIAAFGPEIASRCKLHRIEGAVAGDDSLVVVFEGPDLPAIEPNDIPTITEAAKRLGVERRGS